MSLLRRTMLGLALAGTLAGCLEREAAPPALPRIPSEAERLAIRSVGIAEMTGTPGSSFRTPVVGRGKGALYGAAHGAGDALRAMAPPSGGLGGCDGYACGAALILWAGVTTIVTLGGTIVGGITGAIDAVPAGVAAEIGLDLQRLAQRTDVQKALQEEVLRRSDRLRSDGRTVLAVPGAPCAPTAAAEAHPGADPVVEACVESIGLSGEGGSDPSLVLFATVDFRLQAGGGAGEIYRHELTATRPPHRWSEWRSDGMALVAAELPVALAALAELATEEMFLLVRPRPVEKQG